MYNSFCWDNEHFKRDSDCIEWSTSSTNWQEQLIRKKFARGFPNSITETFTSEYVRSFFSPNFLFAGSDERWTCQIDVTPFLANTEAFGAQEAIKMQFESRSLFCETARQRRENSSSFFWPLASTCINASNRLVRHDRWSSGFNEIGREDESNCFLMAKNILWIVCSIKYFGSIFYFFAKILFRFEERNKYTYKKCLI